MKLLWTNVIYEPIYNALIFIAQNITLKDVGLAVIVLTIIIRLILLPLSKKSIVSQYKMRALEPKMAAIRAKGLPKEQESKEIFALYKSEKINPFSGCLYLIIQLPILFALYFVFIKGTSQPEYLYPFLNTEGLSDQFIGLVDITKPFFLFALLAGVTQAIQAFLTPQPPTPQGNEKSFQSQFTKSLSFQTRYILPIIIIVISAKLAAAVALYWTVANLFSIMQELYFRRTLATANS